MLFSKAGDKKKTRAPSSAAKVSDQAMDADVSKEPQEKEQKATTESSMNVHKEPQQEKEQKIETENSKPKPKPRKSKSLLSSSSRSEEMQTKMQSAGSVLQNANEAPLNQNSQACTLL